MPLVWPLGRITCLFCSYRFHPSRAPRRQIGSAPEDDTVVANYLRLERPPRMGKVFAPRWGLHRRFWVDEDHQEADGTDLRKICPQCHMELPQRIANSYGSSRTIALLGGRNAGKSNYLGVLIHALEHRYQHEVGFNIWPLETLDLTNPGVGTESSKLWHERYNAALRLDGEGPHYAVAATQRAYISPESRIPLIYRISFPSPRQHGRFRYLDLALFDSVGEDLSQQQPRFLSDFYPHIAEAAGLIFLVDPEEFPSLANYPGLRSPGWRPGSDSSVGVVHTVVNYLERKQGRRAPAAVVVTKLDAFRDSIYPGSPIRDEARHHGGFDAETARLISDEVAAYLHEWGAGNLVRKVREGFSDHSFFALSALGQPPDPTTRVLARIRPQRIADPLLWLFWRLGYIPDRRGSWHTHRTGRP
jgi:hypothetical protein